MIIDLEKDEKILRETFYEYVNLAFNKNSEHYRYPHFINELTKRIKEERANVPKAVAKILSLVEQYEYTDGDIDDEWNALCDEIYTIIKTLVTNTQSDNQR